MTKKIEYMCSWCGKKTTRLVSQGRPLPGNCPKKSNGRPHTWVKNRTIER